MYSLLEYAMILITLKGRGIMSEKYFEKALADFAVDFASGGAIRVMADKGYPVKRIKEKLDFPTPFEKVQEIVWQNYLDTKVILLNEPEKEDSADRITYEKVQDEYGRTSFKQVVIPGNQELPEYVRCDFGKRKYQDSAKFEAWLATLAEDDRDYIEGLPWPLKAVWHVKNERMERIVKLQSDMA